jgi:hypothetical protein
MGVCPRRESQVMRDIKQPNLTQPRQRQEELFDALSALSI